MGNTGIIDKERVHGTVPSGTGASSTDVDNPVKIGGVAGTSAPTGANGKIVDAYFDTDGKQHVVTDGSVNHDAPDANAPMKIGGRADTGIPAAVADGDRVNAFFDVYGRQFVRLPGDVVDMEGEGAPEAMHSGVYIALPGDGAPRVGGTTTDPLIVSIDGVGSVVDTNNSTSTPLAGDAVFTGTGTDLLGYSTVCVTLYADVDSAADGMLFEFSTDNSNWDDTNTFTMDVSDNATRRFQFPVTARYFRVKYTNGGGAQGAFRVQTILHTANQLTSIHRLNDDMHPERSAQVMKAVLFGKGQGGSPDFKPVDVTNGGNLKVSVEEFDVGASLPAGTNAIGKLAANSGVDIGDVTVNGVGSIVDANNSTTTPLGAGSTFTGTGRDLLGFSTVCISLYADVDSAVDGMLFEFSPDNSNWDDTNTFTLDISKNATRRFQFPITARYFRLKYTNGAGGQGAFRVQTILHTANQLSTVHRLVDDLHPDRSVQVAKAVLFGRGQGGSPDFKPVDVTNGGNLKISLEEIDAAVVIATEGNVAHDAVDSGNPVKTGTKAVAHGSNPSAVAANDRVNAVGNVSGVPFVIGGHPNVLRLTAKYTSAQTNTVLKTVSGSDRFVATSVSAYCDKANTVDVGVLVEFDAGTDVRIVEHPGIAAGSGFVEGSGAGILAVGGAAEDVIVTCDVPTDGSVTVHVSGYLIEA